MRRRPKGLTGQTARRAKLWVARWLSSPLLGALISVLLRNRIKNMGVVIDTSHPAFTPTVKAQLAFGIYEGAEIRFIRRYLRGCSRVLELGSSLGVSSAHILDVAEPGAEVICVEANPNLLPALRATTTTAARRAAAKVTVIHGAVPPSPHERSSSVVLTLGRSHVGSRVGPVDAASQDGGTPDVGTPDAATPGAGDQVRQLRVPAVDLAEAVRDWTDYALVCDIEGAEAALILAADPSLTGASRLVIELHETAYEGAPVTVADLREALLDMGFLLAEENGRVLVLYGPAEARRQPRQERAQKVGEGRG
jgi:FkbM family methyltransferase